MFNLKLKTPFCQRVSLDFTGIRDFDWDEIQALAGERSEPYLTYGALVNFCRRTHLAHSEACKYFSASMAAIQPVPAAVTACR